jgi:UDP-2,3-diacylglucosamine pyrophosphatase LpxH
VKFSAARACHKDVAMLVIISDLHLNDGTTGSPLDAGALELFSDRLCDLAYRASWRADKTYRPVDRIDLVLLGDTLDIVGSQKWLTGDTRPWHDAQSHAFTDMVTGVIDDILRVNIESLRQLRSLATEGAITVPWGSTSGQPITGEEELPVAVRTHYMVGNHDWPLHLRGSQYDLIRHKVAHHLGLANQHNQPFPHESSESPELHDVLRRHRVLARHGDIFDPLSFSDDRDSSSLNDCLAIELIARFQSLVQNELATELPPAALNALRELDQIRPLLLVPAWMESVLERTVPQLGIRKAVKRLWDELVDNLLQLDVVQQRSHNSPVELIDGLAAALKFSRRDSSDWTGRTIAWLNSLRGTRSDSYATHALAEPDFRNRRSRHIVYGHTHNHEIVPLDASHADGYVLNQTYFNTGSFRRQYKATEAPAGQCEFIASDSVTLLAFYQADERSGRSHETWTGTLAPSNFEPAAPQATPRPSEATFRGMRAPHFAAPAPSHATPVRGY